MTMAVLGPDGICSCFLLYLSYDVGVKSPYSTLKILHNPYEDKILHIYL